MRPILEGEPHGIERGMNGALPENGDDPALGPPGGRVQPGVTEHGPGVPQDIEERDLDLPLLVAHPLGHPIGGRAAMDPLHGGSELIDLGLVHEMYGFRRRGWVSLPDSVLRAPPRNSKCSLRSTRSGAV